MFSKGKSNVTRNELIGWSKRGLWPLDKSTPIEHGSPLKRLRAAGLQYEMSQTIEIQIAVRTPVDFCLDRIFNTHGLKDAEEVLHTLL